MICDKRRVSKFCSVYDGTNQSNSNKRNTGVYLSPDIVTHSGKKCYKAKEEKVAGILRLDKLRHTPLMYGSSPHNGSAWFTTVCRSTASHEKKGRWVLPVFLLADVSLARCDFLEIQIIRLSLSVTASCLAPKRLSSRSSLTS